MTKKPRLVTVFGGSGFIGRHLVRRLARNGDRVRVAVRDTEKASFLKPMGDLGQISLVPASILDDDSVKRAVEGADAVVNLVGILAESGKATFERMHVEGPERIARLAKEAGVARMVQVSALGASKDSDSVYAQTKARGEEAVRKHFPDADILRPSVVFGPEDQFFNMFAKIARLSPVLPFFTDDAPALKKDPSGRFQLDLVGGGGPKFQPVYVGDVAEAIMRLLDADAPTGQTFELGGDEVVSMRDIMKIVAHETRRRRAIVPLPMWVADVEATFLQMLPKKILTRDQVRQLRKDNVVSGEFPGLKDLGIEPTTVEAIVPTYLTRFRSMHKQIILRNPSRGER
ncbi:NAD-dependent epimerase/dehydratase [Caenispirillum salinarum AK4]|uniref:NAD-dependent epimerase/dehydratase n=1 Tax=Caenispirillum salinarum AK4 TaxID=1238182 RepID=K9HUQ2_9PROT|nr:complex I NDUFA9 subunit family protein [Caenispirillum salinarum]EKV31986.1 NAD-dependent epimerase/dehydratase [Caenispirillum salinarum AK4]